MVTDGTLVWQVASRVPFAVQAVPTQINGQDVPAGVYVDAAYILNATIQNTQIANGAVDNAKIADLSAEKITAGTILADRLDADTITSKVLTVDWAKITDVEILNAQIGDLQVSTAKIGDNAVTTAVYAGSNGFTRFYTGSVSATTDDAFATISFNADAGDVILLSCDWSLVFSGPLNWVILNYAYLEFNNVNIRQTDQASFTLYPQYVPLRLTAVATATSTGTQTLSIRGYSNATNFSGTSSFAFRNLTLSAFIRRK